MGAAVFAVQVGGCQSNPPASTGEVTNSDEGPTLLGLRKMLDHHLTRRGLNRADLAEHAGAQPIDAEYRAAIEARDTDKARAAHARLIAALDAVAEDPALPEAKLARVKAKLESRRASLPEARRAALEAHITRLRERIDTSDDRAAVLSALSSLETQLDR